MSDPKKYKTPNGTIVEESALRYKYGDRFDSLVDNGTITSEINETVYNTPNGSSVTESALKEKYGDKFEKLVSDNVLTLNNSFKKKSESQPTATNQELDSEVRDTDGSLGLQDNRGQLVKDIDAGKFDNQLKNITTLEKKQKKEDSYGSELFRSLEKGSTRLGRNLAATPEFLYDLFAIPQNYIAEKTGYKNLEADSEKFKDVIGVKNVVKDFYANRTDELSKEALEVERKYEGGITDNFQSGNYSDGFRLLGKSITESLPSSLGIAITGGSTTMPTLLGTTTAVFGADKNEELKRENPEMSVDERAIKSFGFGFAEGVFSSIGTGGIGVAAKEIIKKEGKEQGAIIIKENLVKMYTELLKKYPIPTAILAEGIEESATQITQNAIDGKPLMDGVSDAFLTGAGSGGVFGIALETLKQATKDNNKTQSITSVEATIDKENSVKSELEMQVKEGDIGSKEAKDIYENWEEIKEGLKAVPDEFSIEQKEKAISLINEKKSIEKEIEGKDPNLVENKKSRIEEINTELKNINAETETTTKETTEPKVETPTPSTKVEQENVESTQTKGIEDTPSPVVDLNPENTNDTKTQGDTTTNADIRPTAESSIQQREIDNSQSSIKPKASEGKTKTYRLGNSDKSPDYSVSFNEGVLDIKDSKGNKPSAPTIRKVLDKYADEIDFTSGNTTIVPEGANADYNEIVAKESNNPAEVAQLLSSVNTKEHIANSIEYKKRILADNVSGIEKQSYIDNGDANNITNSMARSYFSKKGEGRPLDTLAQELSEDSGIEITEQDIVDHMEAYPNGKNDVYKEFRDSHIAPLKQRFTELTGLPANDKFLNKAVNQLIAKEKLDTELQNNHLSKLTNEEFISLFKDIDAYEKSIEKEDAYINSSNAIGNESKNSTSSKKTSRTQGNDNQQNSDQKDGKSSTEQKIEDDDVNAQGISFNKENKRDSALSEEGAVKQKNARQRKFKRFWNNTFSSSRKLDKNIVRTIESLVGNLSAISSALEFEASKFSNISNSIKKQFKTDYNQKMKIINDYLSGLPVDTSFLNKDQQDQLDAFRSRIDSLSDKLIKVLENKKDSTNNQEVIDRIDNLIDTIEGNKGKYIFRQYDAFSNSDYLSALTGKHPNASAKKRLNNAIEYVVSEQGISREEAKTQILTYLDGLKNSGDFISASVSGKAKAPFLKKRKDIPEPIRELLGESKDPVKNYITTVFKMSNYIANLEYQGKLSESLKELGLASDKMKEGYTKLTSSNEGWDYLQDIYVPEEIKESIDDLQPLDSLKDAPYKLLVQASAATKLFKTVLSPTTTARNFLSGFFLSFNAGFNPLANPKQFINGIQQAWGGKKSQTEMKKEHQRLIKLGIINDGAVSREVLGIMNDFGKNTDKLLAKNGVDKFMNIMQRLYALGDDSFKVVGFYQWQSRYIKAGFSKQQAETMAQERIRNGFPTYSKIPKNIQRLRRIPLIGTFPSFTYEVWRTNRNNVKFIGDDLKAGRYKMAAQQATGMMLATSTALALSALSKALLGIDDDEDDTTRNMAAPWQKDSKNIYLGKKNGIYEVVDGTAFFPQETVLKPLRILFEERDGRTIEDRAKLALEESTGTFLGADILTKTIAELSLNQNNYGDKIYRGENILEGISNDPDKITNYILRQAGPGIYNNLSEFARANEIAPEFFGQKETSYKEYTNQEALLGLLGLRVSRINYVQGLSGIASESKDIIRTERSITTKKLKNSNKLSFNDIIDEVKSYQKYNKENHKQLLVGIRGAKKQGIPTYQIEQALKRSGFSKSDIDDIYNGQTPLLKPISSKTVKNKETDLSIGRLKDNPEKLFEKISNLNNNVDTFNFIVDYVNEGLLLKDLISD